MQLAPMLRSLLLAAFALALAAPAGATTVAAQSLETLTDQSSLVVRGTVERVEGFAEAKAPPFRIAHVRVVESATPGAPAVVPVRLLGGMTADGVHCAVAGTPALAPGDDVLLFLDDVPPATAARATLPPPVRAGVVARPAAGPQPARQWMPVGLALGAWRVVPRSDGPPLVVPDLATRRLHVVGDAPGTILREPTPLASVMDAVRARRAGGRR